MKRESWVREFLFIAGALMIMLTFAFSVTRQWPSFDPLVTALLAGIGLLLIVIYERLGVMVQEFRRVADALEEARVSTPPAPDGHRPSLPSTPTPAVTEHR
jgi:hypothetical protein